MFIPLQSKKKWSISEITAIVDLGAFEDAKSEESWCTIALFSSHSIHSPLNYIFFLLYSQLSLQDETAQS